ncbi:3D domain-containing protein [Paenibacillus sp. MER TA 81-3]|uniref:3D domain-containing protein n=1 Tax=Paenibacillus sp. MER TA 81-3 TaxID=2939573 RepID=UPI00203C53AA|nr:3D domain-containing protein [Paenibacillus sp. MER TA 81-3]MCM3339878.1 3D domain-containing protein [Paenibacillus sp. MER TA 81-3]
MRKRTIVKLAAALLGIATILQIIPVYAEPYQAKEGDTIYSIAKKQNISVEALVNENPLINPKNIYGGLTMELPTPVIQGKVSSSYSLPAKAIERDNKDDASKTSTEAQKAAKTEAVAQKEAKKATGDKKSSTPQQAVKAANTAPKNVVKMSGRPTTYSKKLNMRATAYTAHPSENGEWGAVDFYGNALKLGTVAVDPKVIPLGTKLFITGYQFKHLPQGGLVAEARDIGGAIKGNKVDIFVPVSKSAGSTFGVQDVQVYIIK